MDGGCGLGTCNNRRKSIDTSITEMISERAACSEVRNKVPIPEPAAPSSWPVPKAQFKAKKEQEVELDPDQELTIVLRAIRDHRRADSSQINFEPGDLIMYMPQRPVTEDGLGVGRVDNLEGAQEGVFRLAYTEVMNGSSMWAPPAMDLPALDGIPEDVEILEEGWLPTGNLSTSDMISVTLNDAESCKLARCDACESYWPFESTR
jgi:hypothetical protein